MIMEQQGQTIIRHLFMLVVFLYLTGKSTESVINKYSNGEMSILKIKFPIHVFNQYLDLVKEYNQFIDILNEPRITADAIKGSPASDSNWMHARWLIKSNFICEYIQALLNKNGITYSKTPVNAAQPPSSDPRKRRKRSIYNLNEEMIVQISQERNENNSSTRSYHYEDDEFKPINETNFMTEYHSFEQIIDWMHRTAKAYPTIASTIEIGKSLQGRSLLVLKLGFPSRNHKVKKAFWFDSGIHAREWTTISTAMFTIDKVLAEQNTTNSMMHRFLAKHDMYFLLVANPDGYVYSQNADVFWRKNLRGVEKSFDDCFGVDLNRNFGYHWMKTGASDDICSDVYAGSEQNSEPEVKSIQDFIKSKNPNWLSFVSLHSYGGFWLHHWEKKNLLLTKKSYIRICNKPHIALRAIQKKHKYRYLFGIPSNLLSYDAAGASDTWAMMVSNITYAYTIEIGPTQEETMDDEYNYGYGFHVRESQIESIAERAYTGIREYLRSFIEHLTSKVQYEIDKKCSDDYDKLMRTFSGYWS